MRETKSRLAQISDFVLLFVVALVGGFLALRTAVGNIAALGGGVGVAFCLCALFRVRRERSKAASEDNKRFESEADRLVYAGAEKRLDYFAKALSRFCTPEKKDGYLAVGKTRVYPLFMPENVIVSELYRIQDELAGSDESAVVICREPLKGQAAAFIEGSDKLKVLPPEKLRALILDMPSSPAPPKQKRKGRFAKLISAAFQRELFRRYLFAGALLLGTSYILPQSPLYIAFGALCLALAIVCLLPFGKKTQRKNKRTHTE